MKKKALYIISSVCILLCIISLLGFNLQKEEYFKGNAQSVSLGRDDFGLIALVENSIIYEAEDLGANAYFRYYIDTNKTVKIGSIPNYVVADRGTTILDGVYYFYVTISRGEEFIDVLYSINFNTNTLATVEEDSTYAHLIPVKNMNGKLIALKGDMYENNGYSRTYMYEYNPKTKKGRDVLENRIMLKDKKGDAFVAFNCYDDKLYAVIDSGGQKKNLLLKVYDNNYTIQKTYPIKELEDLCEEGIMEINVKGDYVHFLGMVGSSAIGKIGKDKIDIIYKGKNDFLEIFFESHKIQTNQWFFFKRWSNDFFTLNLDTGALTKETRIFKKEYNNWYGMIGENGKLICSIVSGEVPAEQVSSSYLFHYLKENNEKTK